MPPETQNPATCGMQQGFNKSKRVALISGPDSTKPTLLEDHAANYLVAKYGLALPVARTIAALAGLGRRLS